MSDSGTFSLEARRPIHTMIPRLSALIVNFNTATHLASCLRSIAESAGPMSWEAVVVDNASTDGSETAACQFGEQVRLLRNDRNVGFAAAANQAIRASKGSLLLVLNPDCRLKDAALDMLAGELERHPDTALVGPCLLDPDGRVQGSARGDPTALTGLFGRSTWLSTRWPNSPMAKRNVRVREALPPGSSSLAVDWVSGACMMARREPVEEAGGFDERYFLYWEDADLCRRLRRAGHVIRYVPTAQAVHRVGQSSQTVPDLAIRSFHQGAYLYYSTHVAAGFLHPARLVARGLLGARCWWKLRSVDRATRPRRS